MMAAYWLQAHPEAEAESGVMRRYVAAAGWCLNHRKTTALAMSVPVRNGDGNGNGGSK